jgi:hypothetical protein
MAKINQPWPASTEENLSTSRKESPVSFRILGGDNDMRAVDQA